MDLETVTPSEPQAAASDSLIRTLSGVMDSKFKELGDQFTEQVSTEVEKAVGDKLGTIEERLGSVETARRAAEDKIEEDRENLYGGDGQGADGEALMSEKEVKDFRLGLAMFKASQGWRGKLDKKLPEYGICMAAEERAVTHTSNNDEALGLLVPAQVAIDKIIKPLEAKLVLGALGASIERPTGKPYIRPRINSTPTGNWEGENTPAQESGVTDGQIVMTPHRCNVITTLSKSLLADTSASVQAMVTRLLVNEIRRKIDIAGMTGGGQNGSPVGVTSTVGILSQDWSGTVYSGATQTVTDNLESMIGKIEDADAMELGTPKWVMAPQSKRKLRKVKDADGKPMLFSVMRGEGSQRISMINDLAYETTTQLATGASADFILGIWEGLVMAMWEDMRIDVNDRYKEAWTEDSVGVLVQTRVDFGLEHPEMFCVANSFDSTGA